MKHFCSAACFYVLLRLLCCCTIGTSPGNYEIEEISERYEAETEKHISGFDFDPETLLFFDGKMVSETEINFEFSQPVNVVSLSFNPELETGSIEEGSTVKVYLEEIPAPGMPFTADLTVEDDQGNSVSVLVPLRSRNNRVPELLITELRTEYASSSNRAEFIELNIKTAGNMGALRVFAASNNKDPMIYEFLPLEVKAGDYVVLHLRTLEDSCRDEYGGRMDESGGTDSSPTAFDFWIPGSAKLLRKDEAVYVLDQDDHVLDAVMISGNSDIWWSKDYLGDAALFLFNKDAWKSPAGELCRPADAVNSSGVGTAVTRSISRDEAAANTKTAADWFVTATSSATPGKPNVRRP